MYKELRLQVYKDLNLADLLEMSGVRGVYKHYQFHMIMELSCAVTNAHFNIYKKVIY